MVPVFCGKDCGGDACPLLATIDDGRVLRVANNPAAGKYLSGCVRGFGLPSELHARERLLTPLIRVGERGSGDFREASWDEALDLVAARLGEIRARLGPRSILNLGSAGQTSALHGTKPLITRFLNLSGGATSLSSNYSSGAAGFVLPYVLGADWRRSGFDAATMSHSEMIVLWGANPMDTRLGGDVQGRLIEARERGAKIVVVDPRRTATVERLGARWLPCLPGTDSALMLAVLHVLVVEGLVDRPFVERYSVGFDRLEAHVLGLDGGEARSPCWAASICGLPEADIIGFARDYAAARPAMLFPGYSIQRVFAGEDAYRLTVALQVATGNFGRLGGSTGSINNRLPQPRVGTLPVPSLPGQPSVPVLRWPDLVLEGRAGGYPADIGAIYAVGSDFLNQGGDAAKSVAAFRKAEFSVCHELFMTPTARHCDVVLPAAHSLEKEDIGLPWAGNFLVYKPMAVPPAGQARSDYDILCDLAERMGFGPEFSEGRGAAAWIARFLEQSEIVDVEEFKRVGIYFGRDQERTGLADFVADPGGRPLSTPSGKIELASDAYAADTGFPAVPSRREPTRDARFPILLVTPKSPFRTHSQGYGIAEFRRSAAHALSLNPEDAAERGIADGSETRIYNDRGATRATARIDEGIMRGVASLPEGAWLRAGPDGEDLAGSANVLTSTDGSLPSVANIMHGIPVQIELAGPPPAAR
jgi:anaerobic dimethyl sulfoxide reductase subunit A